MNLTYNNTDTLTLSDSQVYETFGSNWTLTSPTNIVQGISEAMDSIRVSEASIRALAKEKKKRVSRKKELPQYWLEEPKGDTKEYRVCMTPLGSVNPSHTNVLMTSPFVNLIPLKYLVHCNVNLHISAIEYHLARHFNNSQVEIGKRILEHSSGVKNFTVEYIKNRYSGEFDTNSFRYFIKEHCNRFLCNHELLDISKSNQGSVPFSGTKSAFFGSPRSVHTTSFSASISNLSVFLENRSSLVYSPQILAVVLPENYMYQKEHILTYGKVDLSKVILLVNRELDSTSFHSKQFRSYYRKHILPIINELDIQVWKVPQSFIEENCFHKGIKLESVSFMDKLKELKQLYQDFRNMYTDVNVPPVSNAMDDDDVEPIEDDDDYQEHESDF